MLYISVGLQRQLPRPKGQMGNLQVGQLRHKPPWLNAAISRRVILSPARTRGSTRSNIVLSWKMTQAGTPRTAAGPTSAYISMAPGRTDDP